MQVQEKVIEKIFLLIALSSIFILALITFFIFEEGIPLILKVVPKPFCSEKNGFQVKVCSASSDDRQLFLGDPRGSALRNPS